MRDLALTGACAVLLVMALRETWVGVLLWTWFSLMNPHKLTWGFAATAPFAQIIAIVTLISLLLNTKKLRIPTDATTLLIVLFVVWMCVTTYFGFYPEASSVDLVASLKIQLMTLVAIMALRERKHIEAFVAVIVLSVGFYGAKGGLFTIVTGGGARVWGPADTYINGNNEIGLALTMVIPLANYLRQVAVHKWVRRALLGLMLLSGVAVLGTQSRGALLAVVAMVLVLWWRSRQRVVGGFVLGSVSALFLALMPQSWEDRMRTIGTYQQDDSAMSRINAWKMAVSIANDRVTGGGFAVETREVYARYAENPDWVFTAHSIYFQALGEHGWLGLALFLGVGATTFFGTMSIRARARQREETKWLYELGGMIQVSMVGYAVGGAFLSLAYLDLAYNIAVIVIACRYWLAEERWRSEPIGLFGSSAPVGRWSHRVAVHA